MNANPRTNQDEEHLRLLTIFHYVVGGVAAVFALFPIVHLILGLLMVFAPQEFSGSGQNPSPELFGWFFIALAVVFITLGMVMAGLILTAGCFLARRRHHLFCFVVAALECLFMPFGTVLGVFTIIVLNRTSVKELFNAPPVLPTPPAQ